MDLGPGFEFLISGGEARGRFARKADLRRCLRDKGLVRPVTVALVSPVQVGDAPLPANLFASGNTTPKGPGIEQGSKVEKSSIIAVPGHLESFSN